MKKITTFLKRHPVFTYFALTFTISWGCFFAVVGPGGIPGTPEEVEALLFMVVLSWLAGPSLGGLLMAGIVYGRVGLRRLLSRLLKWRVGIRWYAVALLAAPFLMVGILLSLSLFSSKFLPGIFTADDKVTHLWFGIMVGLMAGIFEELGWTGFAVPELRRRYGVLATGFIVGLLWALWHWVPALWLSGTVSGPFSLASYLIDPFLYLVVFRVLMVWTYDNTESLLLAMLMHSSLTASARVFTPLGIAGVPLLTFDLVWAAVLWGIIAVAILARISSSRKDGFRGKVA